MEEYTKSNCSWMSEDIRQYGAAFASAKRLFKATGKSGKTTQYKGGYANLDDIYNAVESALLDNSIVIKHAIEIYIEPANRFEVLVTRLIHYPSGQWSEDKRFLESEKPGNQGRGAAQTYSRKYAVLTICGIAPSEDDDGLDEQKYIESKKMIQEKSIESQKMISQDQINELRPLITTKQLWVGIKEKWNISKLEELTAASVPFVKLYIDNNEINK
jgi:hypothetical protein